MSILKQLPELLQAGIIDNETAAKIRKYYLEKESGTPNKLFIIFGILGAILTGLGIILIIAHNWDDLSKSTKTIFAFLPLLIGQIFCGYSLIKKPDNPGWTEGSSVFLFFSVGASISLVSQIYHIPGVLSSFIFCWMLLCLPLVYIMKSSVASMLYIIGITFYGCEVGYWDYPNHESYFYWLLLLLIIPHYYQLYRTKPESNFTLWLDRLIPLSVAICLGTIADKNEQWMCVAYISLFGVFYLIGNTSFFKRQGNSMYTLIGSFGTVCLLLFLTFDEFWERLARVENVTAASPEFATAMVISLIAAVLFVRQHRKFSISELQPIEPIFILFIPTFLLGLHTDFAVVIVNVLVFIIGVMTIRKGSKVDHLGILNYGLLIITALIACRFFDTDMTFVARGILFITVGIGFFAANISMIRKRKGHA